MANMAFNWTLLMPVLLVFGGGVISVLFEAFVPRAGRWVTQTVWSVLVLGAAFVAVAVNWNAQPAFIAQAEVAIRPETWHIQALTLIIAILTVLVMADRTSAGDGAFAAQPSDRPGSAEEQLSIRVGIQRSEIFTLLLFSTGGMMVFPLANSLITMFVALEVMSLPLYILVATARRRRLLSQEAALKYFALGAFASTFFLMGTAFVYGALGSVNLLQISNFLLEKQLYAGYGQFEGNLFMLLAGAAFILIALLFKIAAAPFHAWTPDVYQGAPTPITGFMAAGVKIAAFMALTTLWLALGGGLMNTWLKWFLFAVIILTIVVGTFIGLVQKNVKRLLGYSAIAHAGFMLIAFYALFSAKATTIMAFSDVSYYLLAYGFATIGAFAVFTLVRERDANGTVLGEAQLVSQFNGLGKTHPWLAAALMLFLLSFAGIPLTSGFAAKFLVFSVGIDGGALGLVVVAIIASVITAFYYFRLAAAMYFHDPNPGTVVVRSQGPTTVVIAICAIVTVLAGVAPQLFLNMIM